MNTFYHTLCCMLPKCP